MSITADLLLTPLEVATGAPLGADPAAPSLPMPRPGGPVAALEHSVLGALLRPPCVVSFSGGRDSSAALAVATRVARQQGISGYGSVGADKEIRKDIRLGSSLSAIADKCFAGEEQRWTRYLD